MTAILPVNPIEAVSASEVHQSNLHHAQPRGTRDL
jgi:hypothetical protein